MTTPSRTLWPPTPVLTALRQAAPSGGPAAERLAEEIARDFPAFLDRRAAQLLTAAEATAEDFDRLLADAGIADAVELRQRAGRESQRSAVEPDRLVTQRDQGSAGDRAPLRRAVQREQLNLRQTLEALTTNGSLELAARAILAARHRFVIGDLKSAGYAELLAFDLASTIREVSLVQPTGGAVVTALAAAHPSDVLVAFSFRHYSRLTLQVAEHFHRIGGTVVALTDSYTSPICASADHVLRIDTGSDAATHSPTAVVAVGHLLTTLAGAGAKGASRLGTRRTEVAESLGVYQTLELDDPEDG